MTSNIKEIERVSIALDDIETHDETITLDQWLDEWIDYPANRHHEKNARTTKSVSYTHLTLPTNREV